MMNTQSMSHKITRILLGAVFFVVLIFSIYLPSEVTWNVLLFALFKAAVAVIFTWLFFLILSDTLLKSIIASVEHMQEKRKEGGLLYHFIKPADNEIIPKPELKKSKKSKKKKMKS